MVVMLHPALHHIILHINYSKRSSLNCTHYFIRLDQDLITLTALLFDPVTVILNQSHTRYKKTNKQKQTTTKLTHPKKPKNKNKKKTSVHMSLNAQYNQFCLVGPGFASRYRVQPRAGFFKGPMSRYNATNL